MNNNLAREKLALQRALMALEPGLRERFLSHVLEGLTERELGVKWGMNRASVYRELEQSRRLLGKAFRTVFLERRHKMAAKNLSPTLKKLEKELMAYGNLKRILDVLPENQRREYREKHSQEIQRFKNLERGLMLLRKVEKDGQEMYDALVCAFIKGCDWGYEKKCVACGMTKSTFYRYRKEGLEKLADILAQL